jgi:general secretion pathway protein D
LEIAFPAQSFEVVEVSEGAFFKQDDGATSFTHAVNASTGRIGLAVLRSDNTGATGQAPVVTVRLKAKAAGTATFSLTSFKPVSLGGDVPLAELPSLNIVVK